MLVWPQPQFIPVEFWAYACYSRFVSSNNFVTHANWKTTQTLIYRYIDGWPLWAWKKTQTENFGHYSGIIKTRNYRAVQRTREFVGVFRTRLLLFLPFIKWLYTAVIRYNYTSVSCYAVIYTGYGCSGTQRGRCVWHELCTLFGDCATSTQHHSSQRPRTSTPVLCLIVRESVQDSFARSCQTSSQ